MYYEDIWAKARREHIGDTLARGGTVKKATAAFDVELRVSSEVAMVTWALINAAYALEGRALPQTLNDVHHLERRKYEETALIAVLSLNRDAHLWAERSATYAAWERFEQFVKDKELDWLEPTHLLDSDDAECHVADIAKAAVKRYRHALCGVYPGVTEYLARLERQRLTDGDPALAEGNR